MLNVTIENFEAEVIAASTHTPVLVDFWATWCGPCKVIGPILEKLETAYEGRFRLVKIDSDQEQELAQAFGIRSIPTCILLKNGQPVDGFMGALPEGQIRAFLDKHLPAVEELQSAAEAEEADALLRSGDTDAARALLQEALAVNPANDDARYDYVKLLIGEGDLDAAQHALAPAMAQVPLALRFEALSHWLSAKRFAASDERARWSEADFQARLAANRRDFDARFAWARSRFAAGEWTAAMDELLEIIMRDKAWNEQAPRKTIVAILELITPPKPKATAGPGDGKSAGGIEIAGKAVATEDPQSQLISQYRRRLSMALN